MPPLLRGGLPHLSPENCCGGNRAPRSRTCDASVECQRLVVIGRGSGRDIPFLKVGSVSRALTCA